MNKKKRKNLRIVDWTQERNGKTDDIISEIETKLQSDQEKTDSNKNVIRNIEERQENNQENENDIK